MKAKKDSQLSKTTTNRKEYKIQSCTYKDRYYDECWHYYNQHKLKKRQNIRLILPYQVRMYKTWKHNRNTQWK